jgi:DNA-binding response OmpR family regulator
MTAQVVIIEDHKDLGFIFAEAAHQANLTTEIIADGQSALDYLAQETPQIIILDLHLPHVSGTSVLDYILTQERLHDTRVIIASADAQQVQHLRPHVDFALIKPVGFEQLRQLIERLNPQE